MGSIYKITCTVDDMAYIGKTAHDVFKTRIKIHLNGHGNKELKDAIKKYGKDAFSVEILHDGIIPELLDSYEIEAITKHNTVTPNGYNQNDGGAGVIKHTDETCQKISLAKKGKSSWNKGKSSYRKGIPLSEEHRRRIGLANKGKPSPRKGKTISQETKDKISKANKGKPYIVNKERDKKISNALKGRPRPKEVRQKISDGHKTPIYHTSKEFYLALPSDMSLTEKRKQVARFSGKTRQTAWKWVKKWSSENDP